MPYPLSQLEAEFKRYVPEITDRLRHTFVPVETLAAADLLFFMCPKCFATDGHMVMVCFRGRGCPPEIGKNSKGETVRWDVSGTGLADLALRPSIQIEGCCGWHGFVGSSGITPGHAG